MIVKAPYALREGVPFWNLAHMQRPPLQILTVVTIWDIDLAFLWMTFAICPHRQRLVLLFGVGLSELFLQFLRLLPARSTQRSFQTKKGHPYQSKVAGGPSGC